MPALHARTADGRFATALAFTIADINRDNYDPTSAARRRLLRRAGAASATNIRATSRPIDAVRLVAGAERENSRFTDGTDLRATTGITSVYGQADRQAGRRG